MNIFKRRENAENNAFNIEAKEENREKNINEMIENKHPLVEEMSDLFWIKKSVEKLGNTGSLKKNTSKACEDISKRTGYELSLVKEIWEELGKREEKDSQQQEKDILDKRRQEQESQ
ncbi:MAG: hypothetical protein K9M15_01100 [Candidatus Marinimicrobia bacterium]|nr:hypothetical protein [Candidatus Neomarinimicrobiota bacterium]